MRSSRTTSEQPLLAATREESKEDPAQPKIHKSIQYYFLIIKKRKKALITVPVSCFHSFDEKNKPRVGCLLLDPFCALSVICARLSLFCPIRLCDPMHASLLCSGGYSGKNTGVGCHALLQGIFLTQGSKMHLLRDLHCRQILYR